MKNKVLFCGGSDSYIYEFSFYIYFRSFCENTFLYDWKPNFNKSYSLLNLFKKVQYRFLFGPLIFYINIKLIYLILKFKANVVFIYRGREIHPLTIFLISNVLSRFVIGYNNDNPFSNHYKSYFWRFYIKSLKHYDLVFYYRNSDRQNLENLNVRNCMLLRSYYIPFVHKNHLSEKFYDFIFIGHFESDGRDIILYKLLSDGFKIRVYGWGWQKSQYFNELSANNQIVPLFGIDYSIAISRSNVALVFYSTINKDQYTRRLFEISVIGTVIFSQDTNECRTLFSENYEIIYFQNYNDIVMNYRNIFIDSNYHKLLSVNTYMKTCSQHSIINRCKLIASEIT